MDNRRFDALTRAVAQGASRRSVLKGLIGGVFGGAVVTTRLESVGAQGCTVVEECEDNNPCTTNTCEGGVCTNPWITGCCTSAIECEDNIPCTTNTCDTSTNTCTNPWITGCCMSATECEDNNPCTTNTCDTTTNECTNPWITGCCLTSSECDTCDTCEGNVCVDTGFFCNSEDGCCEINDACCDVDGCCAGACYGGNSGRDFCCLGDGTDVYCTGPNGGECCDDPVNEKCCGTQGCCTNSRCNEDADVCCGETEFACGTSEGNVCCDIQTESCTPEGLCCPSYQGNSCSAGGGTIPDGCPCGVGATCHESYCCFDWQICGDTCCDGDEECVACINGACTHIDQMESCNEGAGVCCNQYCLTLEECCPEYEGNSCSAGGGTIPDGCPCGDGATCHESYCCFDWQICGETCCDGDNECVACINGACTLINQQGSCNGGAGVCCRQYCEFIDECCPVEGCLDCQLCFNGLCVDNCPDCQSCNSQGVCETDCEPEDACTTYTCVNGTCVYDGCERNETCCENGAAHCADLLFSHENCGACGYGCDGCEICFNGQCMETDACCQTYGEPCEPYGDDDDDDDDDWRSNCCEGLVCCHYDESEVRPSGGATMYCAQCCGDSDCGNGKCCHGQCISSEACCSDADCGECEECLYLNGYGYDSCVQMGALFGEYCHQEGGDDDDDDYSYSDCCDGLVCCDVDHDGNRCFECCDDWDCPKGTECKEGVCQAECSHDKDCPDGTCCCKSGHCSKHCCHHAHVDGGPYVDTLPSTGSGDSAAKAGWMGAAALGAAAYFAGKTLRDSKSAEPEAETNE